VCVPLHHREVSVPHKLHEVEVVHPPIFW
jgi:hypothetical protein